MDTGLFIVGLHIAYLMICIAMGFVAFAPRRAKDHRWLMPTFLALLTGFVLFGGGGTIAHWYDMAPAWRFVVSSIVVLGLYALYRGARVQSELHKEQKRTID